MYGFSTKKLIKWELQKLMLPIWLVEKNSIIYFSLISFHEMIYFTYGHNIYNLLKLSFEIGDLGFSTALMNSHTWQMSQLCWSIVGEEVREEA